MTIDWTHFSPWPALVGGVVIGVGATILAFFNGRIAGISGIVGGLIRPVFPDATWRAAFVIGLLLAPTLYGAFQTLPTLSIDAGYPMLIVAGLLVGIGTRYASGCTSGHGVCGISRMSPRSIVATLTFMAGGFATVFLARHLLRF